MCTDCGCSVTDANRHLAEDERRQTIEVLEDLLHENDRQADHNRAHFDELGVLAINIMSGPGSGKTSLLEATIKALPAGSADRRHRGRPRNRERCRTHPPPRRAGGADHHRHGLPPRCPHGARCPARSAAGATSISCSSKTSATWSARPASTSASTANVLLLSVTEGDDKPAKYPVMVRAADQMLITKMDLLPYIDEFSV